jgi:hypothetical protein
MDNVEENENEEGVDDGQEGDMSGMQGEDMDDQEGGDQMDDEGQE